MARVLGSYPIGRWFEPNCRYQPRSAKSRRADAAATRLHGQAVKTSTFHGGNSGSIPDEVTETAE